MNRKDFESWLSENIGSYEIELTNEGYFKGSISYTKPLYIDPTILMVIKTPQVLDYLTLSGSLNDELIMRFFLYDIQHDIVFGYISEFDWREDWREDLMFEITNVENRLIQSICPSCNMWLVERENIYGHKFVGCIDFPACDFSSEIDNVYE